MSQEKLDRSLRKRVLEESIARHFQGALKAGLELLEIKAEEERESLASRKNGRIATNERDDAAP